jgi:tetratricopeptide (TPR) repeat protein
MAKIIPYKQRSIPPKDFKRVHEKPHPESGQLNLFQPPSEFVTILPLAENSFELALKMDLRQDPLAEEYYLKAIERNENPADAYCNLGVLAAHQEKMALAIDYFSKALLADPRHSESHFNLANVYFACRDYPLAILHYQLVNRLNPNFPDAYFNLGLAYLEQEKIKEARDALLQFRKWEDPPSDKVQTIISSLHNLLGEYLK